MAGRNTNNLRYADDITLKTESEEELTASWWGWKNRVKKLTWSLIFRKLRSWHQVPPLRSKQKWKSASSEKILFSWAPKITADGDCSHGMKRHLLHGKKAMRNLESVFKSRDITLPTKVCILKAMVLSVVMYGCENWTAKKAECQRIDAFELWCWRRLLRVPWAWKEIKPVNPKENQSWIFTGRTVTEVPILWPLDVKSRFTGTDPEAGEVWRQKEKRGAEDEMARQHHPLNGHENEQTHVCWAGEAIQPPHPLPPPSPPVLGIHRVGHN